MAVPIIPWAGFSGPLSMSQVCTRLGVTKSVLKPAVKSFQVRFGLEADGVVGPLTWACMFDLSITSVDLACGYIGTREQPGNRGPLVDKWNLAAGAPLGSPWCMSFVFGMLLLGRDRLRLATGLDVELSFPRTGSTSAAARWAKPHRRLVESPSGIGDVFLLRGGPTGYRHTGFVLGMPDEAGRIRTVEGNTNASGSPEGVQVLARTRVASTCDYVVIG